MNGTLLCLLGELCLLVCDSLGAFVRDSGFQAHHLHEIGIDGQAAFVVEALVGDFGPVNLGFDQSDHHEIILTRFA